MKKNKLIAITIAAITLSGCASNNIKSYKPDATAFTDFKNRTTGKVKVESVTMPQGDINSIMCRMSGNIYLPNKMKYSEYVNEALNKVLIATDKLDNENAAHSLSVVLNKVDFNSIAGEWVIDGNVIVDHKAPLHVKSVTKYGTSYIADYACKNAAEAFDEAVTGFNKEVLAHVK